MDAYVGLVTALCAGVASVIVALAAVLRQLRINDRATRRELAGLRRAVHVQTVLVFQLRRALNAAGIEAGPGVLDLEAEVTRILDGLSEGVVTPGSREEAAAS